MLSMALIKVTFQGSGLLSSATFLCLLLGFSMIFLNRRVKVGQAVSRKRMKPAPMAIADAGHHSPNPVPCDLISCPQQPVFSDRNTEASASWHSGLAVSPPFQSLGSSTWAVDTPGCLWVGCQVPSFCSFLGWEGHPAKWGGGGSCWLSS